MPPPTSRHHVLPGDIGSPYHHSMVSQRLPQLAGLGVHLVGAKGTGMAALAEIFAARGARLSGSDVAEVFYTDAILAGIGLVPEIGFDPSHLPSGTGLVLHSAAYSRDSNPELVEAARRGLPIMSYPEALGALSRDMDSSGIAGVHGKTTSTAMAGTIVDALAMPATVLAGSAVSNFSGRCTIIRGDRHFIAETCEYRKHFLNFSPSRILLTSVESDHQDFFPTREDIMRAFVEYGCSLPAGGLLIFCADDAGAVEASARISAARPDIRTVGYGFEAEGPWRIDGFETGEGVSRFRIEGAPGVFSLRVPGRHLVLDAVGALALVAQIAEGDRRLSEAEWDSSRAALADFRGSRRRSEIVGEAAGVLVMDDYAHHPTALAATIRGIREFHPGRRLVVDFMSHTYSRTAALLNEFAASLDDADCVILHKIYASAREAPVPGLSGSTLFDLVRARKPGAPVLYTEEPAAAAELLAGTAQLAGTAKLAGFLRPGDLFLTMGAGDNWTLGREVLRRLREKEELL